MPVPPEFPEFAPRSGRLPPRVARLLVMGGLALMLVLVSAIGAMGLARTLAADAPNLTAGGTHLALALDDPQPLGTTPAMPHGRKRAAPIPTPTRTATPTSPPTAATTRPGTTTNGCTVTATDAAAEQSLLNLLNSHRAAVGVAPLTLNTTLSVASRAHSCDMFQHQTISHLSSDGTSPLARIQATGVSFSSWGENIGTSSGLGVNGGITQIDDNMMAEPLVQYDHHWSIIHAAFTQVGLGVIYANGQVWLTEDFIG